MAAAFETVHPASPHHELGSARPPHTSAVMPPALSAEFITEALQEHTEIKMLVYESDYLANKMATLISVLTGYIRIMGEELLEPQDTWAQKVCDAITRAGEFEDMTDAKKHAIINAVGNDMVQIDVLMWRAWAIHMRSSIAPVMLASAAT